MRTTPAVSPLAHRVFSLTGLVALGAFLAVHVAINAAVLWGPAPFEQAVRGASGVPALGLIEAVFVFAPLAVHGGLGLWLALARPALAPPRPYPPAIRASVRATGVVAAAFVAAHLFEFRFRDPLVRLDGGQLETLLAADMSSTVRGVPWTGAAYLVGTACVSFHFVAGVWGVLAARYGPRRWAAVALGALGALLWTTFAGIVVFHATGARPFRVAPDAAAIQPCPPRPP